mmetsp:Transcript_118437/g.252854  ORF Transcript_118437/g.252854 Transcript_118437/m.252854 type:complete len:426 (+) Transcript_118437:1483-2760(+)
MRSRRPFSWFSSEGITLTGCPPSTATNLASAAAAQAAFSASTSTTPAPSRSLSTPTQEASSSIPAPRIGGGAPQASPMASSDATASLASLDRCCLGTARRLQASRWERGERGRAGASATTAAASSFFSRGFARRAKRSCCSTLLRTAVGRPGQDEEAGPKMCSSQSCVDSSFSAAGAASDHNPSPSLAVTSSLTSALTSGGAAVAAASGLSGLAAPLLPPRAMSPAWARRGLGRTCRAAPTEGVALGDGGASVGAGPVGPLERGRGPGAGQVVWTAARLRGGNPLAASLGNGARLAAAAAAAPATCVASTAASAASASGLTRGFRRRSRLARCCAALRNFGGSCDAAACAASCAASTALGGLRSASRPTSSCSCSGRRRGRGPEEGQPSPSATTNFGCFGAESSLMTSSFVRCFCCSTRMTGTPT